jgi:hypothetical protein
MLEHAVWQKANAISHAFKAFSPNQMQYEMEKRPQEASCGLHPTLQASECPAGL